jgi:membrane protease YdiL (CAAX protease family)
VNTVNPRRPSRHESAGILALLMLLVACGAVIAARATDDWPALWVLLLAAPLAEEIIFRLGLQQALLDARLAPWQANVGTAVAFGSLHAVLQAWPGGLATALPSLLLGLVYQRTGRVSHCVLLHAALNGAWLLLVHQAPSSTALRALLP